MDLITQFLTYVAPKRAAERIKNQLGVKMLQSEVRKYEGAGRGRRFKDNSSFESSQNTQISSDLPLLRKRARDLYRNNPYAKNAIRRIANNVVGTGILATPVVGSKPEIVKIKKVWEAWAKKQSCDFDELLNFYGLQKLVIKTVAKSGACIVRRVWKKHTKKSKVVPLEIQLLEPEFLDHDKTSLQYDNGEYIVNGIQYSSEGKRKAYWIFDRHPTDYNAVSKPVPAEDILYIYDVEDPGQHLGIPFLSTVILRMYDLDEYEDAQIVRQKVAACFAVFVQDTDNGAMPSVSGAARDASLEKVEPGIIEHLPPGKSVSFASPPTTEGYGEFARQSLQAQAAGIGISYEALTGDLSKVNFSSGRMGWLEFQRTVEDIQWNMMIPMFCDRVFSWFVKAAYVSQKISTEEVDVIWTAPRREMIDPMKEIKALVEQVRAGLMSWQEAVKQLGYTPEEILEQLKQDKANFDAAGLMPTCDSRYDAERMNKEAKKAAKEEKVKPAA